MQVASLQEMSRVLCVGGRALIYVWAKDQKKKEMSSYLKQNKKNRDGGAEGKEHVDRETGEFGLPVHINRCGGKPSFFGGKNRLLPQDSVPAPRQPCSVEAKRRRGGRGKGFSSTIKQLKDLSFWSQTFVILATQVFLRYYHVFEEGELESLVEKVEKLIVVESYYDQGNWCSVVEKV